MALDGLTRTFDPLLLVPSRAAGALFLSSADSELGGNPSSVVSFEFSWWAVQCASDPRTSLSSAPSLSSASIYFPLSGESTDRSGMEGECEGEGVL